MCFGWVLLKTSGEVFERTHTICTKTVDRSLPVWGSFNKKSYFSGIFFDVNGVKPFMQAPQVPVYQRLPIYW